MTQKPSTELPNNLAACHELIAAQAAKLETLGEELEKLRKLLHKLVHGAKSEKRILSGPDQGLLPFESEEEFKAAQEEEEEEAEAEAEAKQLELVPISCTTGGAI